VLVDEGEFVLAGDTLANLDTTMIQSNIAKYEGELSIAQAKLDLVLAGPHESEIKEAEIEVTAIAVQTPVSRAESTAQVSDLALAHSRLDYLLDLPRPEDVAIAQAEVNQAEKNLESAKKQLLLTSLIAPADGTVIRKILEAHEFTREGEVVIQMSDLRRLGIQTEMYDFEIARINEGDKVNVTFDALPSIEAEGTVYSFEPDETENKGGRYIVTIKLDDIPDGLRWGMTATVIFHEK
jgi:multidrug resistance efflux pump